MTLRGGWWQFCGNTNPTTMRTLFFTIAKAVLATALLALATLCSPLQAQLVPNSEPFRRHFIGSTVFVALTPVLDPSPEYYQLNYGYRFTPKNVLSVELITWRYEGPLGRPYGPDHVSKETNYPGYAKSLGGGLAYQRFLWRGAYAQVHATAFRQNWRSPEGERLGRGFKLWTVFRLGYHFEFCNNRLFLEPSIAVTSWPINTGQPDAFKQQEQRWNKYFVGEPGLHFGFNF